jgi:uncharacterized membrane-anchored protein
MKNAVVFVLASFPLVAAAQKSEGPKEEVVTLEQFAARLTFQQGSIALPGGRAKLEVPRSFRYLDPKQSEDVLVAWGNPPGNETLGMLFPAGLSPMDPASWGVIITYDDDGYVKDDDAESIDYADLLDDMQDQTRADNKARQRDGYPVVDLIGWAQPPHYDRATHKLYWAKELQFGSEPERTLNYNIRVLGRSGVLVLNAVAIMGQMPEVERGMGEILTFVDFTAGNRYTDFTPGTDRVAEYGIAALVAGGLAAKTGLLKGLLAVLVAGKKFIVIAAVAALAWARRLFKKKEAQPTSG